MSNSPGILFDWARAARIGLPEAEFCEGKPAAALENLARMMAAENAQPVLFTRLDPSWGEGFFTTLGVPFNYDRLSRTGWFRACDARPGRVAIVCAGTADVPVTREVARTLTYLGISAVLFEDCGVAGLWRLESKINEINAADVVVVVAGLDAAIASVLGGLTAKPLIAVPTSVGYGVARAGETALNAMLASCAPGVSVMNIDNGYGAACAAARILGLCHD